LVRVNTTEELGDKALPFEVSHDRLDFLLEAHLIGVQVNFWAGGRFIGIIYTGKIFNFSSAGFFVKALRVTSLSL